MLMRGRGCFTKALRDFEQNSVCSLNRRVATHWLLSVASAVDSIWNGPIYDKTHVRIIFKLPAYCCAANYSFMYSIFVVYDSRHSARL